MFGVNADKLDLKQYTRYQVEVVNRFGKLRRERENRRHIIFSLPTDKTFVFDGVQVLFVKGQLPLFKQGDDSKFKLNQVSSKDEKDENSPEDQDLLDNIARDPNTSRLVTAGDDGREYLALIRPVDMGDTTKEQLLQIIMSWTQYSQGRKENKDVVIYNSSVFSKAQKQPLGRKSVLLTGSFQSFRRVQVGLMLNLDLSFGISTWYGTLVEYVQLLVERDVNQIGADKGLQTRLNRDLNGTACTVTYSKHKFRLHGIDFTKTAAKFMINVDGKNMSVAQYLKTKYNVTVKNPNLALAFSEKAGKSPTYIPIEFLTVNQTRYTQDLTSDERSEMIKLTRAEPADKLKKITDNYKNFSGMPVWKTMQIDMNPTPSNVEAKVLNTNTILWKNGPQHLSDVDEDKGWRMGLMHTTNAKAIPFALICSDSYDPQEDIRPFIEELSRVGKSMGMHLLLPPKIYRTVPGQQFDRDTAAAYVHQLKAAVSVDPKIYPFFILVMLKDKKGTEIYREVKAAADVDIGVLTKCIVMDTEKKWTDETIMRNLLASINGKIQGGGVNWAINPAQIDGIFKEEGPKQKICLMGMDVCHGRTAHKDVSRAALCASLDPLFCKYNTAMSNLNSGQEVLEDEEISFLVKENLRAFQEENKFLPTRIVFWRDGVGEGMYNLLRAKELVGLEKGIVEAYRLSSTPPPKITYLIIQKRNHLRTFWSTPEGVHNPPVGTLVYQSVTDANGLDNFYMYSHRAIQGTARPTHYQVLRNDTKMSVQKIAELSYATAHLHQGCTKSVSVPVPAVRAHKAALRAHNYFKEHERQNQRLRNASFML